LRAEHRSELDRVRSLHATEITNLKKSLFSPGATHADDSEGKLTELEAKYEARLEALRRRLREVEHDGSTSKADELAQALESEREKNAVLLARLEVLSKELKSARQASHTVREQGKDALGSPPNGQFHGDDLQQLKGVGPKMAQTLRGLGVNSLSDVAEWTEDDVCRIAPQIRWTVARIKKSGWVETARRLL
jgi:predicted flap endonuclease-1-like 5' DNA nuclease